MFKINVVCVGKVKEKYFSEGILEYSKRIGRFANFSIIEVAEENFKSFDENLIPIIKDKEAERISPHLKGFVVVCAIKGKKLSSEGLSDLFKSLKTEGKSEITFVIGGSYGLSDEVTKRANMLLSVSDMTFPHTLFRLMLTEQIYRALSIEANVSYHK